MGSYITQLQVFRDEDKDSLDTQIAAFLVGKCLKDDVYYHQSTAIDKIARYEAYIYFSTPDAPTHTITSVTSTILIGTISSPIYLEITESGVYYSLTETFTTDKLVGPLVYGTYEIDSTILSASTLYYFKPYIITCIGTTYSEIANFTT